MFICLTLPHTGVVWVSIKQDHMILLLKVFSKPTVWFTIIEDFKIKYFFLTEHINKKELLYVLFDSRQIDYANHIERAAKSCQHVLLFSLWLRKEAYWNLHNKKLWLSLILLVWFGIRIIIIYINIIPWNIYNWDEMRMKKTHKVMWVRQLRVSF